MKLKKIKNTFLAVGVLFMSAPLTVLANGEDQLKPVKEVTNQLGWVQLENGAWVYYIDNNQGRIINAWKYIDGGWYQFDGNGYLVNKTGWEKLNGQWMYYEGQKGIVTNNWKKVDGRWYQFDGNGYLVNKTGWEKSNGQWMYYEGTNGIVTNVWKYIDGGWYQFDGNGYLVNKTGWEKLNGQWMYYQGDKGIVVNSWKKIDGRWYQFNENGSLVVQEGWQKLNGKWVYYVPGNYGLATNEKLTIEGVSYSFDGNGYWIDTANGIVELAKRQLGTPYQWGGSAPGGFDCSGFIYYVFSRNGYSISRMDVASYWDIAREVSTPQPGDLVFLQNTYKAGPSHMGIYIGNGKYIHADDDGVRTASVNDWYTSNHFLGYGRL
ncbi:NlpC/P60 family protein [Bacillus sp. CGMCC 1.60114]|uniref:NlpC/P60 family protein n=1 Tax=unclassified Bacillus (in: firmicutes) TaxID=185979 RepID=UPI00363A069C